MRIAFIYDHEYPELWRDGLWGALQQLKLRYQIIPVNLQSQKEAPKAEFYLGWGAFRSPVDKFMRTIEAPKGLCIAGNLLEPYDTHEYDVLFYETEWYRPQIDSHPNIYHAFGINTGIYTQAPIMLPKIWDVISVGAFAQWKRQHRLMEHSGDRLVVGQVQKNNMEESLGIIGMLVSDGIAISDMVAPEKLAMMYQLSKKCYIPATVVGGGERAVLEARACGVEVEIEPDNPKLAELLTSPIYDHIYYEEQLERGIRSCL